ncbi:MAG: 50S ribosomal protein L24 [Candidatus Micrarchaeota archaeon]
MKPDTERKIRYKSKLHKKKTFLHVHLSKELRLKNKTRAILVKKGDKVKIMIGSNAGKEAKVSEVDYNKSKVYLEGIAHKTARAKEAPIPFQPSNLMITEISPRKEEKKKEVKVEKPKDISKEAPKEHKATPRKEEESKKK